MQIQIGQIVGKLRTKQKTIETAREEVDAILNEYDIISKDEKHVWIDALDE